MPQARSPFLQGDVPSVLYGRMETQTEVHPVSVWVRNHDGHRMGQITQAIVAQGPQVFHLWPSCEQAWDWRHVRFTLPQDDGRE